MSSYVSGCGGRPATLTGSEGTFEVTKHQYTNYANCTWKIQVDPLMVCDFLSASSISAECSSRAYNVVVV